MACRFVKGQRGFHGGGSDGVVTQAGNFYVIRSETGNQCSALGSGLVCSCREDLRINLADAFWIFWSLCRRHSGTPARRQLP